MNRITLPTTLLLLLWLSPPTQARTHFYDDGDRLTHSVGPDGDAIRYTYDDANNITKIEALTVPKAPSQLSATRNTLDRAQLTWQDNATTEVGFLLQRRTASSYDWQDVILLNPNETSYEDLGLDENTNYVYRLVALAAGNENLTSAYSDSATAAGEGSEAFDISEPTIEGNQIEFSFQAAAKTLYFIESSDDLSDGSWQPEPFATTQGATPELQSFLGNGQRRTLYLDLPDGERRFYRVTRQ